MFYTSYNKTITMGFIMKITIYENPRFVNYFHTNTHFRSVMFTYQRSQLYT